MQGGLGGLYSRYHQTFSSRFASDFEETIQQLLRLVMAAPGPLPLDLAAEVLGWTKEKVRKVRAKIGSYLDGGSEGVRFFHKTLGEWLESEVSGEFFTDAEDGRKALGEYLWGCFEKREKDHNGIIKQLDWEVYILAWIPSFMKSLPQGDLGANWGEFGELQKDRIRFTEAESSLRFALQLNEKNLGIDHLDTLNSVHNLGIVLSNKGCYEEAEILYRRTLAGREKNLGAEHADTLSALNNLGILLRKKGKYDDAEVILSRSLNGRRKIHGQYHPDTLEAMNYLGNLHRAKGNYNRAQELLRLALEGRTRILGLDHPDTLGTLNNLGNVLGDIGDHDGAEEFFRQSLEGKEKVLGVDHPSTLNSVHNLGIVLSNKSCYEEAEVLYRRALEGREKILGVDHPDTLNSMCCLGILWEEKGCCDEAESIQLRVLVGREKTLGKDHPRTISSITKLASLSNKIGKVNQAISLLRKYYGRTENYNDLFRYNLACYECLSGNTEEAKRLIAEHIKLHPKKKGQALKDSDFTAIKNFIETL